MKNKILKNKSVLLSAILFVLTSFGFALNAQNSDIKGEVIDKEGEAVIGAVITIANTQTGTSTDIDGRFSIKAKIGDMMRVKLLGYKNVEQKINSTDLTIILEEEDTMLDELVVVGYGVQRRGDLTAAISSVKASDLEATSVSSLDQGLQGRAAGVVVLNTSGQPGGATSIRIRGTSSINGTNEPLYVIDGVPVLSDAGDMTTGSLKNPASNPLTNINPNDVESMEILKDASATSIYGARGANGVILITTKKGKSGSLNVSANMKYSIHQVRKKLDMLNAIQLAELGNEAADNDGVERRHIFADFNNLAKHSTDWQDQIFRSAPLMSYDVSLSGGGEKSTFYTSVNLFSQDGIIIGSDFKKGTFRFNFDQEISKYVKAGFTSNLSYNVSNGVVTNSEGGFASSITSWALEMNPGLSVYDKNGVYVYENNLGQPNVGNPVQDANESQNKSTATRALINAYLEVKPIKELILKSTFGIDYFNVKDQAFAPAHIKRAESNKGYAGIANRDGYTWLSENTATYLKTFDKHSVNALLGFTAQKSVSENSAIAIADIADGTLGYHNIEMGTQKQMATSGITEWQMLSYLGRVNYTFDNKYLFTLTGRVDGSSKFGEDNKYGFFPSLAAAWRASEEDFIKSVSAISNLKLRISIGRVGNQGIAPYSALGTLFVTEAYVGNSEIIKGMAPLTRSNKDLKWEVTTQLDFGLDLGLLNNRITLGADYYSKITDDLLLFVPNLLHSGYDGGMRNIGSMKNHGLELTLGLIPFDGKFTWNSDITFGYNKNEVTELAGATENLAGASVLGIPYWTKISEGKPIGAIYGYKTDGIVQSDEDPSKIPFFTGKRLTYGDRKYVDKNGDGKLSEEDLYELGCASPDFTFGFNNNFEYKLKNSSVLSLGIFINGVIGNEIVNFNKFALESLDGSRNNSTDVLNRWTSSNPSNEYPRATMKQHGNVLSGHQVEDGSYLRVKNITLGYTLPKTLAKTLYCSYIHVYAGLQNMITFIDYSGYDPEVSRFANSPLSMGADNGAYPMSKSYEFGIKLNF